MKAMKLGLLVILPSLLAYLIVDMHIAPVTNAWLVSPLSWGLLFLAYWFWVGSLFGHGEDTRASFLWGSGPTLLFGLLYLQQFALTAPAARSPLLSLLGQLYVFLAGPVSSVFFTSILGASNIGSTILNLSAYALMLGTYSLGFLWRKSKKADKRRKRRR